MFCQPNLSLEGFDFRRHGVHSSSHGRFFISVIGAADILFQLILLAFETANITFDGTDNAVHRPIINRCGINIGFRRTDRFNLGKDIQNAFGRTADLLGKIIRQFRQIKIGDPGCISFHLVPVFQYPVKR